MSRKDEEKRWQKPSANNAHFVFWMRRAIQCGTFDLALWQKEWANAPIGSLKREKARLALWAYKRRDKYMINSAGKKWPCWLWRWHYRLNDKRKIRLVKRGLK